MKRWIAGLLCIAMLLSLLAGCGAPAEETQEATQTVMQTEPAAEPTTEPTIDPEELFLQSLPADVRRAYEVGLVERAQLEDLDRSITVGEAAGILQKAQTHRAGVESRALADLQNHETFAQRNADRGWLMGIPALVDLENAYPDRYTDYEQWTKEVLKIQYASLELHFAFASRFGMRVSTTGDKTLWNKQSAWDMTYNADGSEYMFNDVILENAPDYAEFSKTADGLYVTDARMLSYGLVIHDGTTGKKYMEMVEGNLNPFEELTFGEVAQVALRLYNAPDPTAYPEFVPVEEVGKYNTDIITSDLLSKKTDLPEASCEKLPASWHGVVFNDLQTTDMDTMHLDAQVYEYEIQAVKDAGFNYIGLYLDFSWLQDYTLFESARVAFHGMIDAQDKGKVNVKRLEQLDQIIAWCMERDIHVDLRACSLPNINQDTQLGMHWQLDVNGKANAQSLADMWQAIARRYADIPNEYLSFTLFSMGCHAAEDTFLPSVDAIRAESPDRCIIAEMNSDKFEAETFAEKGVALSSRIYDYEGVSAVFNHTDCVKGEGPSTRWDAHCLDVMQSFSWPHADTVDALTLFSYRHWNKVPSTMDVISVAEQYGVGCMLSDFGVRLWENDDIATCTFPRLRYPMDSYTAMIRDFAATAENLGLGWCFAYWYSPYGVAFGMPLFDDTTYTQVEDYPYYIDQTVLGCFRELNGVGEAAQAAPTAAASVEAEGLAATASHENPYYEAAAKAGISVENVSTEPINGREMAKLLDQFMAHIAPEKLDAWQKQYFSFRASLEPLSRMDMIASIYLAVQAAQNPDYLSSTTDAYVLSQQVKMDWDAEYLNWLMFGGFENLPDYEVEIFGKKPLDAAAHYYNLARTNPVTGESLLDLDAATNTMRYEDEATYRDAVAALGRLLPATGEASAYTVTLNTMTLEEATALVTSLKVPQDQFDYYLAAAMAGISLDNISTDLITGREMAGLLDQFMAAVAADKLAAWQKQCSGLRVSNKNINLLDAAAAIFLAAQATEDAVYMDTMADAHALHYQAPGVWDTQLTYGLFDDWDNTRTFDVDIFKNCTLDAAAHYYNLGRTNVLTGESLFDPDASTNTMRYGKNTTWQDVIVALGRLLYRDNEELLNGLFPDSTWLFEGEDDAKIAEYRTLAAKRKEAIVNSKTAIVKGETFIPGETYTGTAYYVSPNGDDSNDGKSPETAWQTTNAVNDAHFSNKLKSGDAVFFERGSTYRVDPYHALAVHDGVTYSAYGEGAKPILTFIEGNKADPGFWELYYDQGGMKIWKYHQDITEVGGIVFNDSSHAKRVLEWPTNGKWQALNKIAVEPFNGTMEDPFYCTPGRIEGTGKFRKVEENLPENLNYICRVDISGAAYPMNFVENPKTGMPYTGELYLRCDEGNPGDVFEEIAIIGYSDVTRGSSFKVIDATDISNFVLDNLCIKYYLDTAVHGTLKSENVVIQNCEVGWGGNRIHTVASAQPTGEYFNIGDGLYNIVNDSIIRNNYVYHGSAGCGFENGPMGYDKDMGVFTCSGNLFENNAEGVRCFLFLLEDGDVPIEKMVIQDNMILDTGISMNNASGEMNTVIDIFETQNFAKEILIADNICIGSGDTMLRMGNPMNVNEIYRNNVWVHDPALPFAYLMNSWSNYCIYMDGTK